MPLTLNFILEIGDNNNDMNKRYIIGLISLLGFALLAITSCKEETYTIDKDFYIDKTVALKNEMKGDTLFIEQDNKTDIIMLEEPDNPDITFNNRGFLFTIHDDNIVAIDEEGAITPLSRGVTQVDIVSRTAKTLKTTIFVKVYKQYAAVEEIVVPENLKNLVIEIGVPYDLSKDVIVKPVNADNKKLHFSLDETSKQYAEITDEGIITGIKATGSRNKAAVNIISDEFDTITTQWKIQVVDEIIITNVNLLAGLDGAEISVGEVLDLNLCTSVEPSNVKEENRKLTFELLEGNGVVELTNGVIRTIKTGTAKLKAKAKEQGGKQVSTEFTIIVKEGLTDFTRLLWTVKTSVDYIYVPDGTTGKPQDMFDNSTTTFLSMVKSGKAYNEYATPADHTPYFIVDMKSAQRFNYVRWNHRSNNTNINLRVWGFDLAGSNDGETWTSIKKDIIIINKDEKDKELPYGNNSKTHHIDVPQSEYRYVKIIYSNWSDKALGATDGYTLQVAEFGLGYK